MRFGKWVLLVFALAMIVAACGGGAAETTTTAAPTTTAGLQTIETGYLTIGSDIPYPPFEDFDANGNVVGFDADLMNEIASRLGLTPRWVDTDFDTIFTQLAQGNFDVVASATTITPEREQMVAFSTPYFNANQALAINEAETPNIKGVDDLVAGDTIAVQTGTTGAIWATDNLAALGIIIREFVQPPDCFTALEGGQVTGAILDIDTVLDAADTRPNIVLAEEIVTGEAYGFAVNPANPALLAAINSTLADMFADGFYQTTYDRWISRPGGSVLYTPPPPAALGTEENPIEVLYVPSVAAEDIIAGGELLAQELNNATGLFFEVSVPTSYAATVEEMCASPESTMGFIPANAYVLANNLCGVEVSLQAVRNGYPVYWTEFIVPRDSDLMTLQDLEGKTWAYPDPGSTSGYLFPMGMFVNLGITPGDGFEAGGHTGVVRAIYNGEADFGTCFFSPSIDADGNVIWDGTAADADVPADLVASCALNADGEIDCSGVFPRDARRNLREENPDVIQQVRILALSDEIPNDTMSFGPDFPAELRTQIVDAMKAFAENDPDGFAQAFNAYSWTGVADSVDANFDIVRIALQTAGFSLEDLG
jgi:phosphate/phosphite/phosphonate ABC transporter binding protein